MNIPLVRLDTPDSPGLWYAIGDTVMGGISSARMSYDPAAHCVFSGVVSLAHGGGFASVRSPVTAAVGSSGETFLLTVRGDGKRYKFSVRTHADGDGLSYQAAFEPPAGEWALVRLAAADFVPTWRGRIVANAAALAPSAVRQLGLLIADRQAGAFRLEIRAIELAL
ncbi:CIA30 family protein [Accumulibacter sp.]|uniref:CIA30 family protein n=1 Tax=Accumulibacter sp. TaxID=2053492 RepID=UPI0028C469D6|nr:CIA30 family protein [Accumulibacter sp.]